MVAFASRPRRDFFLPNNNSRVGLHDILLWGDKPKGLKAALLGETKVKGAKARSSEELKFLSSQATLSYRVAVADRCSFRIGVATDAKSRTEPSLLELCRDAKEENYKLTDAFIAFSDLKVAFPLQPANFVSASAYTCTPCTPTFQTLYIFK